MFTLKSFSPKITISQRGTGGADIIEAKTGNLLIQSLPVDCTIDCPALNKPPLRFPQKKSQAEWFAEGLPEGKYQFTFSALNRKISSTVVIEKRHTRTILVNFLKNKVIDLDELDELQRNERVEREVEQTLQDSRGFITN